MRKSLKSIISQTKLNLSKKIKKLKQGKNQSSVGRKESELECFKRIKPSDISLQLGVHPEKLKKTLTMPQASELDKATARILLSPLLQTTIRQMTDKHGVEFVESFLKDNETNISKNQKKPKQVKAKVKNVIEEEQEDSSGGDSDVSEKDSSEDESPAKKPKRDKPAEKKQSKPEKAVSAEEPMSIEKPTRSKAAERRARKQTVAVVKKSVDPFFVDSSGQNYNASLPTTLADSSDEDDDRPVNNLKMRSTNMKRFEPPSTVAHKPEYEARKVEVKAPPKDDPNDLHPSWKAKAQMRKVQIQDFKGTKIKFDD